MVAGLVAYLVQEQFSFSLPAVSPIFWLLAGLLVGSTISEKENYRYHQGFRIRKPAFLAIVGIIIALVLLVSSIVMGYSDFKYYQGLKAYTGLGNLLEAERWFKEAIALNPLKAEYRLALGRVYRQLAYQTENPVWIKKAVTVYKEGITYDPTSPNLYFGLGEAYYANSFLMKTADYSLAKKTIIQGLDRLPYSEDGRVLLAESLIQEGNIDQAFKELSYVLKYSPSDFGALYNMGVVFEKKRDSSTAANYFLRALEINPHSLETRTKLRGLGIQR